MSAELDLQTALGDVAARQLANATKTRPQLRRITPRWLTQLLPWVPVEAGIYRLNRVKDEANVVVDCSERDERPLPQTFVDYEEHPREYMLSAVNTVVDVQPILRRFGVETTVRPSLALYNTCADIDALVRVVSRLASGRRKVFGL